MQNTARHTLTWSIPVIDIVFIGGIVALIAAIAFIARGVEKL